MPGEVEKGKISLRIIGTMPRDAKESKKLCDGSGRSKPRPILALDLTEEIPLEKVYVGILKEKRNTSKAIQLISTASSGGGFGHLKRCNGHRLLLSPADITPKELRDSLASGGFDLSLIEDEFEVLEVPSKPSKTKLQAEICGKIWPINFHPDQQTESIISGDIFNEKQLSQIELLMRLTIEAARIESIGNSECNGSALIVDPESGQPLALASSKLDEHPLWHASMLAIDLVAKIQGGGAWDLINEEKFVGHHFSMEKAKRKLNEKFPLCYPPSLSKIHFPHVEPLLQESSAKSRQKNKSEDLPNSPVSNTTKTGPYLCTNFWIFLLREPCPLCAMALLHSRASKIFYGVKTTSGVLGSKALLHTTPGLNHRYQVWSGILENECEAVCDLIKTRELKLG